MKKVEFGEGWKKSLDVIRITQGKAEGDLLHIQVELKNISSKEVMLTHKRMVGSGRIFGKGYLFGLESLDDPSRGVQND